MTNTFMIFSHELKFVFDVIIENTCLCLRFVIYCDKYRNEKNRNYANKPF